MVLHKNLLRSINSLHVFLPIFCTSRSSVHVIDKVDIDVETFCNNDAGKGEETQNFHDCDWNGFVMRGSRGYKHLKENLATYKCGADNQGRPHRTVMLMIFSLLPQKFTKTVCHVM